MNSGATATATVTATATGRRAGGAGSRDGGSTIPLILGFFLIAFIVVAASIALGQAFVQQRDLQDTCDGAAAAAAASSADLDRRVVVASGGSLQFADADAEVTAYLERDPTRAGVQVQTALSPDHETVTLRCVQTLPLVFGRFFEQREVRHVATSSARAAVVG